MPDVEAATQEQDADVVATPYLRDAAQVVDELGSNADDGLSAAEAATRLGRYGPNVLRGEKAPSVVAVALAQLRDPMNLMLVAVAVVSLLIDQVSTGVVVGILVVVNVVMGAHQEMKARASVDALAKLQVPQAKVLRGGQTVLVPAEDIVPGDIVALEAGDLVPADGRIVRSATLETQEAALTGESAPIAKSAGTISDADVGLGDRVNMTFQNTQVTRGTAAIVVTATGMSTEMGRIATMLTSVKRTRSPLQTELDGLTKVIGVVAWVAVALIVAVGIGRGLEAGDVLFLGTAMAIGAIPTGLPTFVQAMLSGGAKRLAEAKAVVKNLTDVETLGATTAINTDKTGTLTMNEMMVSTIYGNGTWFHVDGEGYAKTGAIRAAAGVEVPDFTRLAYGLALATDATVSDTGDVVGDPTEAALVVLAAKVGIDAEETRRAYPRLAEVPFDSEYKFMATFHRVVIDGHEHTIELVKGAPDVVLARCSEAGRPFQGGNAPIDEVRADITAANERLGEQGLRVLSFAIRILTDADETSMRTDPMTLVGDLTFVGMVGIIDPLRPSAKVAVATALGAGIDVRMITGDHAVTAAAIGADLGLGPGSISGPELRDLSDDELAARLPELHVFGRVSPEDKLRLAQLMQREGMVVAMTGDAVNDAAALKQADIGVAMGSGAEVSKQAARMILTDDNFGTLVHAVELGRNIYSTITAYIRYQMTQLMSLVMLFVAATIFNINDGVALTPLMVLFLNFFICLFPVAAIMYDEGDPDAMRRPPRDPNVKITNRFAVSRWFLYGAVMFVVSLVPLLWGPDTLSTDHATASMTMSFVVLGLATIFSGLVLRREPGSGFLPPVLSAIKILAIPVVLMIFATELGFLQRSLMTRPLTGFQWLVCLALALVLVVVVEVDKWIRRMRTTEETLDATSTVAPARALAPSSTAAAAPVSTPSG